MKKILLIGADGMLGGELEERLCKKYLVHGTTLETLDICNRQAVFDKVEELKQDLKKLSHRDPTNFSIILKQLDKEVKNELIKNFDRLDNLKHSTTNIKAFTEKGLYMLATILKGERATKITIKIIDTFAKFKEITSDLSIASNVKNQEEKANVLQRAGLNLMDLLTENLHQETITTKTKITLDLGIIKVEREVEKSKSK